MRREGSGGWRAGTVGLGAELAAGVMKLRKAAVIAERSEGRGAVARLRGLPRGSIPFLLMVLTLLSACSRNEASDKTSKSETLGRSTYSCYYNMIGDTLYGWARVYDQIGDRLELRNPGLYARRVDENAPGGLLYEGFASYLNVYGNTLYFINGNGQITGFDFSTGKDYLAFCELDVNVNNLFIINNTMFYIVADPENSGLFAYDLSTKANILVSDSVTWRYLSAYKNMIVFQEKDGMLRTWDPETGEYKDYWQRDIDSGVFHIMDDATVIESYFDTFYRSDDPEGNKDRLFSVGKAVRRAAVVEEGIYYTINYTEQSSSLYYYSFSTDTITEIGEVIYPDFDLVGEWLIFYTVSDAQGVQVYNTADGKMLLLEEKIYLTY